MVGSKFTGLRGLRSGFRVYMAKGPLKVPSINLRCMDPWGFIGCVAGQVTNNTGAIILLKYLLKFMT